MIQTNSQQHNPALNHLEGLVGEWKMELSNAAFLPNPSTTVKAPVSFEWGEKGAFLCMRMGDDALWLMSRDKASLDYYVAHH